VNARAVIDWHISALLEWSKRNYVSPVKLATFYAERGDKEKTLALLAEGYRPRSTEVLFIQTDTTYDSLHNDPHYRSLVQFIGLPPA
jgi:hypothetical protein